MPIPVLKFPILVIAEIIKSMDHKVIFFMSLASTRTKNVIKASMTRTHCSVTWTLEDTVFRCSFENLRIESEQDPPNQEGVSYKIGSSSYKVFIGPVVIHIYWTQPSDKTNCVKHLMTHISEIFNKPSVFWFIVDSTGTGESELEILKHAKSVFPSIDTINYMNIGVTPEVFLQTFNEFPNLEFLCLGTNLPDDFEFSPNFSDNCQIERIFFRNKIHWVKLDDYMECRYCTLIMDDTTRYRTPAILNAFIRKWVDTDCRLEVLKVMFRDDNFDFPAIANGLGEIRQDGNEQFVEFEGANGKQAKILKSGRWVELKVRK